MSIRYDEHRMNFLFGKGMILVEKILGAWDSVKTNSFENGFELEV